MPKPQVLGSNNEEAAWVMQKGKLAHQLVCFCFTSELS